MGSPSRFTAANRTAIITRIGAGDSLAQAATAAGVSINTTKRWLKQGALEPDSDYGTFRAGVERARAAAHALAPASEEPMTPEEFRRCVEVGVRAGTVSAMALYANHFLKPPEEPKPRTAIGRLAAGEASPRTGPAPRDLDELAERREPPAGWRPPAS
jgi:hypothetical protein